MKRRLPSERPVLQRPTLREKAPPDIYSSQPATDLEKIDEVVKEFRNSIFEYKQSHERKYPDTSRRDELIDGAITDTWGSTDALPADELEYCRQLLLWYYKRWHSRKKPLKTPQMKMEFK